MSGYRYVVPNQWMNSSEITVHSTFNRFAKELYDRKWEMTEEINNWHADLIRRLNGHAEAQKRRLEEEYQRQANYLETGREQLAAAARQNHLYHDNNQINELLAKCNALKCELGAPEFSEQLIPFIECLTEEEVEQAKRKEKNETKVADKTLRNNGASSYDNYRSNNVPAHVTPSTEPTVTTSNYNNQLVSSASTSTSYDNRQPNNNNSNRTDNSDGELIDKCPTCFMIFPGYMILADRAQHIQEHFNES